MGLQNQTPAHANNGKTPYKLKNKIKPNLSGLQEFGVATYVKDLKARKLDARAKLGCFVGYDSKSKGYQIYWPERRSRTIECNIVFNQNDIQTSNETTVIHSKAQSEGEKDKIIQASQNNSENTEKPDTKEHDHQHTQKRQPEPHQDTQASNSITFPSIKDNHCNTKPQEDDQSFNEQYGHGKRSRPPPGAFKNLNEGLIATITIDLDNNNECLDERIDDVDGHPNCLVNTHLTWHSLDKVSQIPKLSMKHYKDQMARSTTIQNKSAQKIGNMGS